MSTSWRFQKVKSRPSLVFQSFRASSDAVFLTTQCLLNLKWWFGRFGDDDPTERQTSNCLMISGVIADLDAWTYTRETHFKLKGFQYKASFPSAGALGGGIALLAGGAPATGVGGGGVPGVLFGSGVPFGSWDSWNKEVGLGVLSTGLFWGEETEVNDRFSPFPWRTVDSTSESLVPAAYLPVL